MKREPAYSLQEFAVKVGVTYNHINYRWTQYKDTRPKPLVFKNPVPSKKAFTNTKRYPLSELQKWWDSFNDN